ncbi:MAG: putative bifunctional diguanylate cyclase/phosphodiesterase, partial [Mycobacterium sp.]
MAVAIAAALTFVGFAAFLVSDWSHGQQLKAVDDLVIVAVSVLALVLSIIAARSAHDRLRAGWIALSAALTAWTVGEILWFYDDIILGEIPFPSAADGFFLLFPIGAAAALLLFRSRRGEGSNIGVLLDGVIVAGSLFIVSWVLVMSRVYAAGAATTFEFGLLLAYPVLDLVLVWIATMTLVGAPAGQRVPMTLITLGLACMAVADSGYAYLSAQEQYTSGSLVDLGWVAGLLLLSVAATVSRSESVEERAADEIPGWAAVWLPYAPVVLAGIVLILSPSEARGSRPVLAVGVVTALTLLVRQYVAVRDNRRLIAAVADQALRDPLTGLANRALFGDRLNHALQMRQRYGTSVGVMMLDLDDFKIINDNLGHSAGDDLLRLVGERISGSVRPGDAVARLGGDEFAVLVEGDPGQFDLIARQVLAAFETSIELEDRDLLVRPSLGLAVAEAGEAVPVEDLLKRADLAMYAAKRSRTSQVHTFTSATELPGSLDAVKLNRPDRSPVAGAAEAVQLLGELRRAVEHAELSVVYQPKFAMRTGKVVGVEALVRWLHPERGVVGPDEFLPLVRGHQLMESITDLVLDTALDDARRWSLAGLDLPVAVNLSVPSVTIGNLPERINSALLERGLSPSALVVEITEDLFLEDSAAASRVLLKLRELGIRIAIDDFGSGYSALWYLRDLPVDEVKLDRSFIAPIATDPKAAAVARAVIDLAHVLLLTIVAEGVEDRGTAQLLQS